LHVDDLHTRAPLNVRQKECDAKMAAQRAKYGTILRSKGFIWLAGRDDMSGEVGQAGAVLQLGCGGPWMGLMPEELWPEEGSDERDMIERDMAGPVLLDRRQELVFIGQNLNETAITTALNDCLVTRAEASRARAAAGGGDESLRKDEWKLGLGAVIGEDEDPFPAWYGIDRGVLILTQPHHASGFIYVFTTPDFVFGAISFLIWFSRRENFHPTIAHGWCDLNTRPSLNDIDFGGGGGQDDDHDHGHGGQGGHGHGHGHSH